MTGAVTETDALAFPITSDGNAFLRLPQVNFTEVDVLTLATALASNPEVDFRRLDLRSSEDQLTTAVFDMFFDGRLDQGLAVSLLLSLSQRNIRYCVHKFGRGTISLEGYSEAFQRARLVVIEAANEYLSDPSSRLLCAFGAKAYCSLRDQFTSAEALRPLNLARKRPIIFGQVGDPDDSDFAATIDTEHPVPFGHTDSPASRGELTDLPPRVVQLAALRRLKPWQRDAIRIRTEMGLELADTAAALRDLHPGTDITINSVRSFWHELTSGSFHEKISRQIDRGDESVLGTPVSLRLLLHQLRRNPHWRQDLTYDEQTVLKLRHLMRGSEKRDNDLIGMEKRTLGDISTASRTYQTRQRMRLNRSPEALRHTERSALIKLLGRYLGNGKQLPPRDTLLSPTIIADAQQLDIFPRIPESAADCAIVKRYRDGATFSEMINFLREEGLVNFDQVDGAISEMVHRRAVEVYFNYLLATRHRMLPLTLDEQPVFNAVAAYTRTVPGDILGEDLLKVHIAACARTIDGETLPFSELYNAAVEPDRPLSVIAAIHCMEHVEPVRRVLEANLLLLTADKIVRGDQASVCFMALGGALESSGLLAEFTERELELLPYYLEHARPVSEKVSELRANSQHHGTITSGTYASKKGQLLDKLHNLRYQRTPISTDEYAQLRERGVLEFLSERERAVLDLRVGEQMQFNRVVERLDMPRASVHQKFCSGLRRIDTILNGQHSDARAVTQEEFVGLFANKRLQHWSKDQAEVCRRVLVEGESNTTIALQLRIPVKRVENLKYRALLEIKSLRR